MNTVIRVGKEKGVIYVISVTSMQGVGMVVGDCGLVLIPLHMCS